MRCLAGDLLASAAAYSDVGEDRALVAQRTADSLAGEIEALARNMIDDVKSLTRPAESFKAAVS